MAVSPKERKALNDLWNKSRPAGVDIPDGKYGFQIIKAEAKIATSGQVSMVTHNKIVDAEDDEFLGQVIIVRDNLGTEDNIGWFKKKLHKLGFREDAMPDTFDEVMDSSDAGLAAQMVGLVYEGASVFKNDFLNIYVNKTIGKEAITDGKEKSSEDEEEGGEEESGVIEKGDMVSFTCKGEDYEGEIIELLEDEEKARIKIEGGKIFKMKLSSLELVLEEEGAEEEGAEEEGSEEEEEGSEETKDEPEQAKEDSDSEGFPEYEDFKSMKSPELKKTLKEYDFDTKNIAAPREFAMCVAGLLYDPKFKPSTAEIKAACSGLDVKAKRGDAKGTVKKLRAHVKEAFA